MSNATDTTITVMLFEGGALIDALSNKAQGQALASKIEQADRAALYNEQSSFDLVLDPIEVGMAINALTAGNSDLGRSLGEKLEQALAAKLQELGIEYGQTGGNLGGGQEQPGLGGQEQPGLGEEQQPATSGDGEAPSEQPESEEPSEGGLGQAPEEPATDAEPTTAS